MLDVGLMPQDTMRRTREQATSSPFECDVQSNGGVDAKAKGRHTSRCYGTTKHLADKDRMALSKASIALPYMNGFQADIRRVLVSTISQTRA